VPSAIFFMVPRRILPDRVFGRRGRRWRRLEGRDRADLRSRTSCDLAFDPPRRPRVDAGLEHDEAEGTWPLSWSAAPITAHSATSGWPARTSSIAPVERRWPATLMMSSVRP
jgi:hypothetical protein